MLSEALHNLGRLDRRRLVHKFGVTYQTAPETCEKIPQCSARSWRGMTGATLVRCGMTGFGASGLNFELQFEVHSEVYDVVFNTPSKVLIAILWAFNDAGAAFAYTTQTTFTAAPDGTLVMPYAEPPIAGGATKYESASYRTPLNTGRAIAVSPCAVPRTSRGIVRSPG